MARQATCKVRECPRRRHHQKKGLCDYHYKRKWEGRVPWDQIHPDDEMALARNFPGAGVVECRLCGGPVRDHSILEPCDVGA